MIKGLIAAVIIAAVLTGILYGCSDDTKTYTTVIRMNPGHTVETWHTYDKKIWAGDGSVTFKPIKMNHKIRITGNLTVYSEPIIVVEAVKEDVEKKDGN